MNCILIFHFILLLIATTLLILGVSTPRWLVSVDDDATGIISEHSYGIIENCQRFYRQTNNTAMNSKRDIHDNAQICFNYLFQWQNAVFDGPELMGYQKVLIAISFGCVFVVIISLLLTQLINTEVSFYKIHRSKRIVDYLLITNILTVILAMIVLTLFFGFEHLENIHHCGYSFWSFVLGTCCLFLCCILVAIFRIDVEFEYHRYHHESVATLC